MSLVYAPQLLNLQELMVNDVAQHKQESLRHQNAPHDEKCA